MKTLHSKILLTISFIITAFTSYSQDCSTNNPDRQDVLAYIDHLENSENGVIASALNQEYFIPIHLHIVNDDEGNPPSSGDLEAKFITGLNGANSFFTNGMQFILCGVSEIDNSEYINISTFAKATSLNNEYNVPNALNAYIVQYVFGEGNAAASFPWGDWNSLILSGSPAETLAHELGHYFGLLHTFQWPLAITPDNEWNSFVYPNNCWCCECADGNPDDTNAEDCYACGVDTCDCNANNSGDLIDDTPVDPGRSNCPPGICEGPCFVSETFTVNGVSFTYEATYTPDYNNLMSYFTCRNTFSPKQLQRMKMTLLTYPTRMNLVDEDEPNCDIFISSLGRVEKVAIKPENDDIELVITPFGTNDVTVEEVGIGDICVRTTQTTEGVYFLQTCNLPEGDVDVKVFPEGKPSGTNLTDKVNTLDLLTLQRHITTVDPLKSSFQFIAADVDNSGSLNVIDYVNIRRAILSVIDEFPAVSSWRYVPDYALSDEDFLLDFENNPFTALWQHPNGQEYSYSFNSQENTTSYLNEVDLNLSNSDVFNEKTWSFKGVKSGDVLLEEEIENELLLNDQVLGYELSSSIPKNAEFYINLVVKGNNVNLAAYQFGLLLDDSAIEIIGFEQGDLTSFTPENFSVSELENGGNFLKTLWVGRGTNQEAPNFQLSSNGTTLFKMLVRSKKSINQLDDIILISKGAIGDCPQSLISEIQ